MHSLKKQQHSDRYVYVCNVDKFKFLIKIQKSLPAGYSLMWNTGHVELYLDFKGQLMHLINSGYSKALVYTKDN